jgi:hypothetical protein
VEAIAIKRDLDAFLGHFAPDCVFRDMSEAEPRVGHNALRQYMSGYLETMTDMEVEYLTLFSDAEFVLGEFVIRGTYWRDGENPSGTRVALRYCVIDEIRNGLIQRETAYPVPQELYRQLDAATRLAGAE